MTLVPPRVNPRGDAYQPTSTPPPFVVDRDAHNVGDRRWLLVLRWTPRRWRDARYGNILVSDGAFSENGSFHPLETWDADLVMNLFREGPCLGRAWDGVSVKEGPQGLTTS